MVQAWSGLPYGHLSMERVWPQVLELIEFFPNKKKRLYKNRRFLRIFVARNYATTFAYITIPRLTQISSSHNYYNIYRGGKLLVRNGYEINKYLPSVYYFK